MKAPSFVGPCPFFHALCNPMGPYWAFAQVVPIYLPVFTARIIKHSLSAGGGQRGAHCLRAEGEILLTITYLLHLVSLKHVAHLPCDFPDGKSHA